ncbi:MAG: iron-sulfur cluster co-chaperone HscB C-terminal domain-containing protein [Chitinophagaceae bacterium]
MNYFELFDIPVSIQLDSKWLTTQYVALQKKFHPDFFGQASIEEQSEVMEKSAAINKAFKIFQKEEETIKYILQLKGLLQEEEKYQLPPDFLLEVMELNESLSANSANEVAVFEKEIYEKVRQLIEGYNDESVTKEDLLTLKDYYFRKKYLQRILERMAD